MPGGESSTPSGGDPKCMRSKGQGFPGTRLGRGEGRIVRRRSSTHVRKYSVGVGMSLPAKDSIYPCGRKLKNDVGRPIHLSGWGRGKEFSSATSTMSDLAMIESSLVGTGEVSPKQPLPRPRPLPIIRGPWRRHGGRDPKGQTRRGTRPHTTRDKHWGRAGLGKDRTELPVYK